MVDVRKYYLSPTALIPNSPNPLLHYPRLLQPEASSSNSSGACLDPPKVHDTLRSNLWRTQWIFRYGPTQRAHYHSRAHECMVVMSGTARIRFGVADTTADLDASTYGGAHEDGGIEVEARVGDVFILPAGTAHKTYETNPPAPFTKLLTPGDGHGIKADSERLALEQIELEGFTMIGAYPMNASEWDFHVGGEDEGAFHDVWMVPKPEKDPILGSSAEGLSTLWT